jgi:hypothetical protein
MHHGRHREILKILRKIQDIDGLNTPNPRAAIISSQARRGSGYTTSTDSTIASTDASSDSPVDDRIMKRGERKKLKKSGLGGKRKQVEIFSLEDMEFISEAIHLSVHESKGAWEGTYIYSKKPDGISMWRKALFPHPKF